GPSIEIETRLTVGLPLALADANQIELALLNLATNARDAMPDGGKVIVSAREIRDGDTRYVGLSLTDQGGGMDDATLARATEPFFTTKGVGKGTGLGLPMVHGMAEQMGGRFHLRSEKGKGTTAEIWLPLSATQPAAREADSHSVETPTVKPLTVVAVDDDALVLLNSTAMLEDMGHTVLEATSGAQALELIRNNKVDLVITDQAMPLMTGAQLLEAVRQENADLPVLIATGYAELPKDTPKDIPILAKPFSSKELERAVGLIMGNRTPRNTG
ncbi:MAG TPA: ATP-binding protein, partial [Rhizomicrobium sp.]|nr:ATP-binding protein [Rhizomicrobium sp.]